MLGLALGDAPVEVGAALAVALAELADRGQVQRVVEGAVAALGDPVHGAAAGGELDRGGAVVGGVAVPVGEPGDVAGVADQHRGDDRADPEDVGEARARRGDGVADASSGLLDLRFDAGDVVGQLGDQVVAELRDRVGRGDAWRGTWRRRSS